NGGGNTGGALKLDVRPDVWNLNWENAAGNLQAFVRGRDAGKIDLDSIELSGSEDEDKSISPRSTRFAGGQVVATFSKSDAIGLFEDAKPGQRRTVTLTFEIEGEDEAQELTDQVRIVGKPDGGGGEGEGEGEDELHLDIQPGSWNTNWERSLGQVHVFLRGSDARDIDLRSIVLVGTDEEAEPVEAVDVRRVGKQVVARFSKREAYASLDDPRPGEKHEVVIRFAMKAAEGEEPTEKELKEKVLIVGPAR
ncbi:MAG TPA: hypothetical protein VEL74_00075, partial [Thermoanaerobaculia bacterium]|nr:hypothetical protein [Thermoanaerobaculia bacterium]